MIRQTFYPIVVTPHLTECRDFYRRWFGLAVVFEASWFVLWIDVVEQIDPVAGWWDQYLVATPENLSR